MEYLPWQGKWNKLIRFNDYKLKYIAFYLRVMIEVKEVCQINLQVEKYHYKGRNN